MSRRTSHTASISPKSSSLARNATTFSADKDPVNWPSISIVPLLRQYSVFSYFLLGLSQAFHHVAANTTCNNQSYAKHTTQVLPLTRLLLGTGPIRSISTLSNLTPTRSLSLFIIKNDRYIATPNSQPLALRRVTPYFWPVTPCPFAPLQEAHFPLIQTYSFFDSASHTFLQYLVSSSDSG